LSDSSKATAFGPAHRHITGPLLGTIGVSPRDEFLDDGFPQRRAGNVIDRIVNAGPDAGISALLTHGPDELRVLGKQICQHL